MPRLVHFEIPAQDPEGLAGFYRSTLGWSATPFAPLGEYMIIRANNSHEINGGIAHSSTLPSGKGLNIFEVEDIEAVADIAIGNGGKLVQPMHIVPTVGWRAYLADPQGNTFGIITHSA
ncbi:VOC family protein [Streptomyces collinus]|uniref:VOC family protein n=1 Tax=Streptomyces collinus TaxID=42684 RepID=UPI00369FC0BA